jgi:predicted AAA+ superfamily ATPase
MEIITDKILDTETNIEYYYDDNKGIWNNKFEWCGSYDNNKRYLIIDNIQSIKNIKKYIKKYKKILKKYK